MMGCPPPPPHAGHQPLSVLLVPELGDVGAHLLRLLPGQVLDEHGAHHGLLGNCHLAEQPLIVLYVPEQLLLVSISINTFFTFNTMKQSKMKLCIGFNLVI